MKRSEGDNEKKNNVCERHKKFPNRNLFVQLHYILLLPPLLLLRSAHFIKDLRFYYIMIICGRGSYFCSVQLFFFSVFSKLHYSTPDRAGESLALWIECVRVRVCLCVAIWWAKKKNLKTAHTIIFRVIRIHLVFFVSFFFSFVFSL